MGLGDQMVRLQHCHRSIDGVESSNGKTTDCHRSIGDVGLPNGKTTGLSQFYR